MVAVIKQAVKESGLPLRELARRSGVSQPQLSRFMNGERTITLASAEKLFQTLGLQVIEGPKKKPKAR